MMEIKTDVYQGDCNLQLKNIPANSVDLIVTSPPYADQRKNTYGGIHPDEYVKPMGKLTGGILFVLTRLNHHKTQIFRLMTQ